MRATAARKVPLRILLRRFFHPFALFALISAAVGVLIATRVLTTVDMSPITFRGERAVIAGRLVRVVKTGTNEPAAHRGKPMPIRAHHYEYSVDGRQYRGVSYDLLDSTPGSAEIEYLRRDPARSRIVGMRMAKHPLPAGVAAAVLCVLFMLSLPYAIRRSVRNVLLLRHGTLVAAPLATTRGDDLRFYFHTADRKRIEVPTRDYDVELFRAGKPQRVLYDPARPQHWMLLRPDELVA